MNADLTPMNAEKVLVGTRISIAAFPIICADSTSHVPSRPHRRSSAFIGVRSAFIGVSKDFRLS
ncbi:MAG: hypothetical protein NDI88_05315 [Lysobacter sp.]|nr:hypothetical protein [Lysobacter sp.]